MTLREAVDHLRERARVQRDEKTAYNRLRWNSSDIRAVETLVAALTAAAEKRDDEETGMERYVIEISVIAPAADDATAEHIGAVVTEVIGTAVSRAKASRNGTRRTQLLASIEEVTVANVDGDFLKDAA